MIKLPEPVDLSNPHDERAVYGHSDATLKQAVRDAVEACAKVADCRDLPATSAAIRALIKEIPE